ncbi:MAG: hypothetical protein OXF05_08525 [Hyphomicrobiales bacterium]|nr:hypothetical protein [Hyphomicrobiales bacterium]MCY4033457.1 hypothetical protein [Hyphomicrobiales bacterium]MCY4038590.1 hypothetical protein [Hyphomicrobiales bacterium]
MNEVAGKSIRSVKEKPKTGIEDLPNLEYTRIKKAVINGNKIKTSYWKIILYQMIDEAGAKDESIRLDELTGLSIKRGCVEGKGFSYREKANVSVPPATANQSAEAIIKIARYLKYEGVIEYRRRNVPQTSRRKREGSVIL